MSGRRLNSEYGRRSATASSPVAATRLGIIALASLGILVQALIEPSPANLATAFIAGVSSILTALYVFRRAVMSTAPISSLMVFGLGFTLLLGPLIFQTLDWRPIAFNLDAPITAVSTAAFASLLACLTHAIYRAFPPLGMTSQGLARSVHTALFLFRPPTNAQLWLMGFAGLIATWVTGTAEAGLTVQYGDVGGKFLQAFTPFVLAPALIPVAPYLFRPKNAPTSDWIPLIAYFGLVLVVAFARNSRGAFATILLVLLLCLAIAVWTGHLRLDRRVVFGAVAALVLGLPTMSVLSDLSTAMLINRSIRDNVSATSLVEQTFQTAGDKSALENYRLQTSVIDNRYNEIYIRNDFFQRLTLLKFLDLNVRHIQGITESQREYARHIFGQRLIASLPTPMIQSLGLDVDKTALRFSGGDVYRFIAGRGNLGSYVTGSSIADGMAIMGALFWPFFMLIGLISFIIYDSFCRFMPGFGLVVSPAILFQLDRLLMFGLNGDNLAGVIGGLLRGYPQTLFLYVGLFLVTSIVSVRFTQSGPRPSSSMPNWPRQAL